MSKKRVTAQQRQTGYQLKAGHLIPNETCHPERSEGSLAYKREILRFAQDDKFNTVPS